MWNLSIYGERITPSQAVADTGSSESRHYRMVSALTLLRGRALCHFSGPVSLGVQWSL